VHKTANILDALPKSQQPRAKENLHAIWQAATRQEADRAFDLFVATYEAKYRKATEYLTKDREQLLVFYDFPAEHWIHLRTRPAPGRPEYNNHDLRRAGLYGAELHNQWFGGQDVRSILFDRLCDRRCHGTNRKCQGSVHRGLRSDRP
jgi:hypothetical protein